MDSAPEVELRAGCSRLECYPEDVLSASGSVGTKAAREWAEAVRADGGIPLKEDVYDAIHDCAAAVTEHPLCRRIFADGDPEVSVFNEDPGTGVWMRGRLDWIMPPRRRGWRARPGGPENHGRRPA